MNLKRSDEDKARDGRAVVVSESVFRSDYFPPMRDKRETKLRDCATSIYLDTNVSSPQIF